MKAIIIEEERFADFLDILYAAKERAKTTGVERPPSDQVPKEVWEQALNAAGKNTGLPFLSLGVISWR